MPNGMKIFSGRANPALTAAICKELGLPVGQLDIKQFADAEIYPRFLENIRGADVYLIQPTCAPVNDNLIELALTMNAAQLASAKRVTVVMPYFGYARQDRKDRPRVPISALVAAQILRTQRAKRVLTMDLHSAPIQGFFSCPVDNLYALPVFVENIKTRFDLSKLTVVSPDTGGTARARLLAQKLSKEAGFTVPMAILDKFRESANVSEVMNIIGDVRGRNCLLIDDMIDTAGTLVKGAAALMERGEAASVDAIATHGIFSYDHKLDISAMDKIEQSALRSVIVTDTIPQEANLNRILRGETTKASTKLQVLSVAHLFATAIKAVQENESVSSLFV